MKIAIEHSVYGEIVYEESAWTGRKNLSVGGTPLKKESKSVFRSENGQAFYVTGNYLTGSKLNIGTESIQLTPSIKWYEIVLSVLPFIFILVWGNSVQLCKVVPVVGGAIGGAVSGMLAFVNLFVIKGVKPVWLKVVISVATFGLVFLICWAIALAILA